MKSDAERWDKRWSERSGEHSGPVPTQPDALRLAGAAAPSSGRALDIACGLGANAVWLALRGLQVGALDVSPVAIAATQSLAHEHGVSVNVRLADFDDGLPGQDVYDLVVCQRFRDPSLYPTMMQRLAPGGLVCITVLSVVGRDDRTSPFLAKEGELTAAFGQLDVLFASEREGEAHLVARRPLG